MHTKIKTIKSHGARYISDIPEFKDGLPHGILNKKKTDSGGTFAAMCCESNYIVVVPFIDLIHSIAADENLEYECISVFSGIEYDDFESQINRNEIHKIVVMYDSFPKVIGWLFNANIDPYKYKVLVDEYHLLLLECNFREKAIENLMNTFTSFRHYTLMSSTPIKEDFNIELFKNLPYTEIDWGDDYKKLTPERIHVDDVYKTMVSVIDDFIKGNLVLESGGVPAKVDELFIFLNSVTGIKKIISSAKLTKNDVKVVCSEKSDNYVVMDNIPISRVTEKNARINFFTKKGFQGCNLFTNNGLVIILSDGNKLNTLIDIDYSLHQIAGRLRTNSSYNNIFKDTIWHIYSQRKNYYTRDKFREKILKSRDEAKVLISDYNHMDQERKELYYKRTNIRDLPVYYDTDNKTYVYSELKEKYFWYLWELSSETYFSDYSVDKAYNKSGLGGGAKRSYTYDEIILEKIKNPTFKRKLIYYVGMMEEQKGENIDLSGNIDLFHKLGDDNEIFKEAYEKLGPKGINTCRYRKDKIEELLKSISDETVAEVLKRFFERVGENKFVSNAEVKKILKEIYTKLGFLSIKPTTILLEKSKLFEVKTTQNRIGGKQVDGLKLMLKPQTPVVSKRVFLPPMTPIIKSEYEEPEKDLATKEPPQLPPLPPKRKFSEMI